MILQQRHNQALTRRVVLPPHRRINDLGMTSFMILCHRRKVGTSLLSCHHFEAPRIWSYHVVEKADTNSDRPSTYAETPLETQSWAHVTPKHNNWNNPTDLTTSWSSYNKPMATSAQYPPLIKISNTQPTQTPAARTDMQYIAGARNTGRGGGTAPQRSAWGKPAHSNAQGAPHNARSNSQASPQTGHRRQQPELAQRGRNTSRSVASRGRGSRQAVNPAPRPTTQTNNPFAALQDSTESVDDTEDEREFIRTTLKAPAPAPSRKNSPKKKKSAKSSAAANLKAEYGLPPPTPVRLPVKKGLTPGPKKGTPDVPESASPSLVFKQ